MNKTASIIVAIASIVSLGVVLFDGPSNNLSLKESNLQNVEIRDGIQYITINARGGYSPRVTVAKADLPTKLVVKTNGTYDCSAALVIKSIGYKKVLPQTGEEVIDLGVPKEGTVQGLCSMGMYNFSVNFNK